MRILLSLHASLSADGGASGVTQALGDAYVHLGHEVAYFSLDDLGSNLSQQARLLLFPLLLPRRLSQLQRSGPVHVVDASSGDASLLIALGRLQRRSQPVIGARSHGLEHVVMEDHLRTLADAGLRLRWRYRLYNNVLRLPQVAYALRHSDVAMFLNDDDRNYAVGRLGVRESRAVLVSNGLQEAFLGLPVCPGPVGAEHTRIAQVGSYLPRKGIKEGAAALHMVLERYDRVTMSFIGTGCHRAHVLEDFDSRLHDRINVVPRYARHELPGLLADHHIKLFPTYAEGASLALLEAMACGLAPVATGIAANLGVVKDGETGIVVPPRDSAALVAALDRLLVSPPLLERLRRNAHVRAQAFGWRAIAETTLDLYRQAGARG